MTKPRRIKVRAAKKDDFWANNAISLRNLFFVRIINGRTFRTMLSYFRLMFFLWQQCLRCWITRLVLERKKTSNNVKREKRTESCFILSYDSIIAADADKLCAPLAVNKPLVELNKVHNLDAAGRGSHVMWGRIGGLVPPRSSFGSVMSIQAALFADNLNRISPLLHALNQTSIVMLDRHGTILSAGLEGEAVNGYAPEDIVGQPFFHLFHEGDCKFGVPQQILDTAETRESRTFDCRHKHKDGSSFRASLTVKAIRAQDAELAGFLVSIRDMERQETALAVLKKATQILIHSQKLDALGQLTGGIAHDFNNILTVVINSLEFLSRAKSDARGERLIRNAQQAATHGAKLTQQLLAFSRRQPTNPRVRDPNELIRNFEDVLRRACGETIELSFRLHSGIGPVSLDATQFETALLNMAINARDAMPKGGSLVISTWLMEIDASIQMEVRDRGCAGDDCPVNGRNRFRVRGSHKAEISFQSGCAIRDLNAGIYTVISVKDSGSGIPCEVLPKVFDPFFTTKEVGKGTGLGLSQVYGFVMQSKGHIAIDTAPGRGTVIRFYLPVAEERPQEEGAASEAAHLAGKAEGTVLIVEDDDNVRDIAVELFMMLGFSVRVAADGAAALVMLEREGAIDLLFSDIVMPGGIDGFALARRARELRPALKVILASGYPSANPHDMSVDKGVLILAKPYDEIGIARAIETFAEKDEGKTKAG